MFRSGRIGVMVAVAVLAASCGDPQVPVARSSYTELVQATSVPVPAATPTAVEAEPAPEPVPARQPGLTDDVVRVAVIFDDETAGASDQLFRDAWLGALAWQSEVNRRPGGLGGRQVEVVPIDSKLFDHRSAIEEACAGDFFAIVGSQSLGDHVGAELLGTEACNLADFPGAVHGSRRAISPVTFVSNPLLNDYRQAGPARYLLTAFPEASQNVGLLYYLDTQLDLSSSTERTREMLRGVGMNVVLQLDVDLEENPADRIAARWSELGAQSLVWTADPARLIDVLQSLAEPPEFVLCDWGCYSQQFLIDGGEAVEGVYTWIPHSPFDSPTARGDLFLYRFSLAQVAPNAGWSEIGLQTWMAGRLFEQAFLRVLEVDPERPTREMLINAARTIDFFTANNVLAPTNPGGAEPTPCFALVVVRDGRWEQEYPLPTRDQRDQDCSEDNLYQLVTTRSLGTATAAAPAPTPVDGPTPIATPDLENPDDLDE